MTFSHFRETDTFYPGQVRVTLDEAGQEKRVIRKTRLKDINFHSPQSIIDFRISASTYAPSRSLPVPLHVSTSLVLMAVRACACGLC